MSLLLDIVMCLMVIHLLPTVQYIIISQGQRVNCFRYLSLLFYTWKDKSCRCVKQTLVIQQQMEVTAPTYVLAWEHYGRDDGNN